MSTVGPALNNTVFNDGREIVKSKGSGKSSQYNFVRSRDHSTSRYQAPKYTAVIASPRFKGSMASQHDSKISHHRPVWLRVHRDYLSRDTLDCYDVPWTADSNYGNYLIIQRDVTQGFMDELFEHTEKLRNPRTRLKDRERLRSKCQPSSPAPPINITNNMNITGNIGSRSSSRSPRQGTEMLSPSRSPRRDSGLLFPPKSPYGSAAYPSIARDGSAHSSRRCSTYLSPAFSPRLPSHSSRYDHTTSPQHNRSPSLSPVPGFSYLPSPRPRPTSRSPLPSLNYIPGGLNPPHTHSPTHHRHEDYTSHPHPSPQPPQTRSSRYSDARPRVGRGGEGGGDESSYLSGQPERGGGMRRGVWRDEMEGLRRAERGRW